MRRCGYCGRENQDVSSHCCECGTEFPLPTTATDEPSVPVLKIPEPQFINLADVEGAFAETKTFSKVEWTRVDAAIQRTVTPCDQAAAWDEVVIQWMLRLREELGGNYYMCLSPTFVLLSALPMDNARSLMAFAEQALKEIRARLLDLAYHTTPGRHVVLLFQDEDDYYDYSGVFEDAEVVPGSLGMHFGAGYPHLAIKHESVQQDAQTLVHELTHHCITYLPIPLWLNEGVAQRLERAIAGIGPSRLQQSESNDVWAAAINWIPPLMWDELAEKHRAFWNENNIQEFWAGTSFGQAEDARDLSYSLAEVLVHLLGEDREAFLSFLSRAHYDDGGQTAALDCLRINLGEAVGTFLGEGNWRPVRRAIVRCWESRQKDRTN